jgi:hypothetical protein
MATLKLDGKTGRREDGNVDERVEGRQVKWVNRFCPPFHLFAFLPSQNPSRLPVFPSSRLISIALVIVFACGCDQKQQSHLEKRVEGVANSVQKTTATTVERTLQETVVASQSGGATLRVKTALTVSSRLEGAQIDVELQGQKIILRGNVQTARQKTIAHSIAQNTVDPKFKIINRLVVPSDSPKKSSPKKSFRHEQPHRAGL